jgi:hypothetical protein
MRSFRLNLFLSILILCAFLIVPTQSMAGAEAHSLRVGVAKVDITGAMHYEGMFIRFVWAIGEEGKVYPAGKNVSRPSPGTVTFFPMQAERNCQKQFRVYLFYFTI